MPVAARALALAGALGLQALLIALLALPPLRVGTLRVGTLRVHARREIVLPLTPLRPPPARPTPRRRPPIGLPRLPLRPDTQDRAPAGEAAPLSGLSGALFGCAPGQSAARAQHQHCDGQHVARPDDDTVRLMNPAERSVAAGQWARDTGRQQQPALLPCASPQGIGVSIGTILCLAKGVTEGFDVRAQPGYMDKPEVTVIPNHGEPVHPYQPYRD